MLVLYVRNRIRSISKNQSRKLVFFNSSRTPANPRVTCVDDPIKNRNTISHQRHQRPLCFGNLLSRAGLTNVRTCSAEQGPPHVRGPHTCEKKIFLSQNCLLVKETAQNKLVEIRSFSLESRVGFVGALPHPPFSTECHKYR